MRLRHGHWAVSTFVSLAFLGVSAYAQPISGTLNLSGTVMGSTTGVSFYFTTPGSNNAITVQPNTGSFAPLGSGSVVTMNALQAPTVTPGTNFPAYNWIDLWTPGPAGPGDSLVNIELDATSIPIPSYGVCSDGTTGPCRVNAASPVVLSLRPGSAGQPAAVVATLNVYGVAYTPGETNDSDMTAAITSIYTQYNSIAAWEDAFNAGGGSVPDNGFQANITVTPISSVPEPQTFALIAGGLLVGFGMRKKLGVRKS